MPTNLSRSLCAGIFLLSVGFAGQAENLTDPTRPPTAPLAGYGPSGVPAEGGLVLQSVYISPARKAAMINGETVELGGKFDDGKLIKVSESEVVLSTSEGLQTLKLFPDVEKRAAKPAVEKKKTRNKPSKTEAEAKP